MFSKQSIYAYSSLRTDEQGGLSATGSSTQPRCMKTPHIFQTVKISLYSLILFFLGFVLGQFFTPDRSATEGLTLSVKPYKFEMERLFGDKPSNESNAAWERLFPARGGFFNHPTIAPKRSAYAVFHQLHCLVSIDSLEADHNLICVEWPSSGILDYP